jgi:hypothetical protein
MENTNQQTQPITVQDLDSIRAIIDLAATRGAFRGAELEQVGIVFNKLNAFLENIVAQAKAAQEEAEANAAGSTTAGEEAPQGE